MRLIFLIAVIVFLLWILSHAFIFAPVGLIIVAAFVVIFICVFWRRR